MKLIKLIMGLLLVLGLQSNLFAQQNIDGIQLNLEQTSIQVHPYDTVQLLVNVQKSRRLRNTPVSLSIENEPVGLFYEFNTGIDEEVILSLYLTEEVIAGTYFLLVKGSTPRMVKSIVLKTVIDLTHVHK